MITELLKSLEDQSKNMEMLISAAKEKQTGLVKNNYELIDKANSDEEKVLSAISVQEEKRIKVIEKIYKEGLGIAPVDSSLDSLIAKIESRLSDNVLERIEISRAEIKSKVLEINELNKQNRFLIQQASSLIKNTIAIVTQNKNHALLDRKA